jgi:serine/threonine protein kinase/WD40 repeat protein
MGEDNKKKGDESEKKGQVDFPTLSLPGSGELSDSPTALLGTRIGSYKLVSVLGEGGFGIVYRAEQEEPVKRDVALKIIKPGMDSIQVIGRFEAERQALAWLDHPNIAHIYDGGTTEAGRPYFVMEYVEGTPITEYCDEQKLSIEERLELFEQVCKAAQHAHQKGIIHRDIKPSNVLVSLQDDKPVPKIIDFGIAKAVSQSSTEQTFTEEGQFVGTTEYTSPEQATLNNQDIDTRSDIYSLGVLLYELLTGTLPFESSMLHQVAFDERLRIIREEDPPRPSACLSGLGEEAQKIAQCRQTEVATLTKCLHKELEWIPLKAMRKEPDRRYQYASEFGQDIRNYLNGNPLIAGPDSMTYRARKFAHKHTGLLASAVSIVVLLVASIVGFAVSTSMYFKAEQAKKAEQEQRELAEKRAEEFRIASYHDKIHLADRELEGKNYYGVHKLLESCPDEIRGWEWRYLWQAVNSAGFCFDVSQNTGNASFASDGEGILKIDKWTVQLLDVKTRRMTILLKLNNKDPALALSPDGKRIACWHRNDRAIQVLDVPTQLPVQTFNGYGVRFPSVVFSPDGDQMLTYDASDPNGITMLCNVATGTSVRLVDFSKGACLAFSLDGKQILSASKDGTIRIWDTGTTFLEKTFHITNPNASFWSVTFSLGAPRVAAITGDNSINIWHPAQNEMPLKLTTKLHSVTTSAFSNDGRYIALGGHDGMVSVWDAESGDEVTTFRAHETPVGSVRFSPDDRQLLTTGNGRTGVSPSIGVWQLQPRIGMKEFSTSEGWRMAITPNGAYICLYYNNRIEIWERDLDTVKATLLLPPKHTWTNALAFSQDGKHVVAGSSDSGKSMIHILDLVARSKPRSFSLDVPYISAVAVSLDGRQVIVGARRGIGVLPQIAEIVTVDAITGTVTKLFEDPAPQTNFERWIAFSCDGKFAAICTNDSINVWNVKQRAKLVEIPRRGTMECSVAFSSDQKYIVSGGILDMDVKVWDVNSGIEVKSLAGGGPIWSAAFSPDDRRIVSGGFHETITVWDTMTGMELLTLDAGSGVSVLGFSPDGRWLLSRCGDKIKVWDSTPLNQRSASLVTSR